jgi:hypothetical protein
MTDKDTFDDNWDAEDTSASDWEMDWDMSMEGSSGWIWGVVLLIGGSALLAQNLFEINLLQLRNWWAVFILVPGLASLAQAVRGYQFSGRIGPNVRRKGMSGFFLTALALTFFFDLSWGLIGPVFLIGIGLFMLLGNRWA